MVIDFQGNKPDAAPLIIKDSVVERVDHCKYLGVLLNEKLTWADHVGLRTDKKNPRLYCMRKLISFYVKDELYRAVVFWDGVRMSVKRIKSGSISRGAGRLARLTQRSVQSVSKMFRRIMEDKDYHLHLNIMDKHNTVKD